MRRTCRAKRQAVRNVHREGLCRSPSCAEVCGARGAGTGGDGTLAPAPWRTSCGCSSARAPRGRGRHRPRHPQRRRRRRRRPRRQRRRLWRRRRRRSPRSPSQARTPNPEPLGCMGQVQCFRGQDAVGLVGYLPPHTGHCGTARHAHHWSEAYRSALGPLRGKPSEESRFKSLRASRGREVVTFWMRAKKVLFLVRAALGRDKTALRQNEVFSELATAPVQVLSKCFGSQHSFQSLVAPVCTKLVSHCFSGGPRRCAEQPSGPPDPVVCPGTCSRANAALSVTHLSPERARKAPATKEAPAAPAPSPSPAPDLPSATVPLSAVWLSKSQLPGAWRGENGHHVSFSAWPCFTRATNHVCI